FCFPLHVPVLGSIFFIIVGLTTAYAEDYNVLENCATDKMIKKINLLINPKIKIIIFLILFIIMLLLIDGLVIKPYVAEIYYFKGIVSNEKESYIDAASNFEYAAQLDPFNGRILHASGTSYFNLMIYDKAEKILQRTKNYIVDVNTYDNLGLLYSRLREYQKAEGEFKQAIYLNPKFSKTYYDLGYLYFIQKKYDNTIEQWDKILEIEPDFPNKYIVLNNLGIVYNKKEMPDEALEYFLQALYLVPEGDLIEKEIEEEINKIYKSRLEN
ncbi:tetratricopeptide repeat protein, partial [bacterium]|nr:tetratricopeptide repeat protein [bacterium]